MFQFLFLGDKISYRTSGVRAENNTTTQHTSLLCGPRSNTTNFISDFRFLTFGKGGGMPKGDRSPSPLLFSRSLPCILCESCSSFSLWTMFLFTWSHFKPKTRMLKNSNYYPFLIDITVNKMLNIRSLPYVMLVLDHAEWSTDITIFRKYWKLPFGILHYNAPHLAWFNSLYFFAKMI